MVVCISADCHYDFDFDFDYFDIKVTQKIVDFKVEAIRNSWKIDLGGRGERSRNTWWP